MADIAYANVTVTDRWTEGGTNGKKFTCAEVEIALNAVNAGGTTNKIPASAFGMRKIVEATSFRDAAGSTNVPAGKLVWPSADGLYLYIADVTPAALVNIYDPVDYVEPIIGVVKGYPARS